MRRPKLRYALIGIAASIPLAAVALLFALTSMTESPDESSSAAYDALRERQALRGDVRGEPPASSVLENVPGSERTEESEAPAEEPPAPVERITINRIGVDAPVIPMGIDANGYMEAPNGPDTVAWYDFTTSPGNGSGNAVFSGHLDYRNHGPAVFWDLKTLEEGDVIELELADGTRTQYTVMGSESYAVTTIDMADILADTSRETLTLITCAGEFVRGDYTERLVVRAVRTEAPPAS